MTHSLSTTVPLLVRKWFVCSKKVILYLNGLRVALRGTPSVVSSQFQVEGAEHIKNKTIILRILLKQDTALLSHVCQSVSQYVTGVTSQVFSII